MEMTRKALLKGGALAAGALVLAEMKKAAAAEPPAAPTKAPLRPPDATALHFPVLRPADYDAKKMWSVLKTKKAHKFVYQSVEPRLILPRLASLYLHLQNSLNAGEFSLGWGRGNVASAAVLYGPSVILALNDSIWAKYGLGARFEMRNADGEPETSNVYYKAQTTLSFDGAPDAGGNVYQDWSAQACIARGTAFMVCNSALNNLFWMMAMHKGLDPAPVVAEVKANLLPGFLLVPAGVGALHAAMEQGWKMLPLI